MQLTQIIKLARLVEQYHQNMSFIDAEYGQDDVDIMAEVARITQRYANADDGTRADPQHFSDALRKAIDENITAIIARKTLPNHAVLYAQIYHWSQ